MDRIELKLSDIPETAFVQAIKVRDIVKARALSTKERNTREPGAPDIQIEPLIGQATYMSKAEAGSIYTYSNGRKVNFQGWKSDKRYVLVGGSEYIVLVMQVPQQHFVKVGNSVANGKKVGDYIVCLPDAEGLPDKGTCKVVNRALFRKMCYIPMQDAIERNIGRDVPAFDLNERVNTYRDDSAFVPDDAYQSETIAVDNNGVEYTRPYQPVNPIQSGFSGAVTAPKKNTTSPVKPADDASVGKYTIVAQVVNEYGQRIGFVIQSKSGETRPIMKDVALRLCTSKKISNADAVNGPNGQLYLRGRGVQLDMLPITYL